MKNTESNPNAGTSSEIDGHAPSGTTGNTTCNIVHKTTDDTICNPSSSTSCDNAHSEQCGNSCDGQLSTTCNTEHDRQHDILCDTEHGAPCVAVRRTLDAIPRERQWYLDRIEYLSGFMTPERDETLRSVLDNRTKYMTICMENTFHPQNASALVRHCDAFGLQDIYTIEELCRFSPNVNIVKGTDKWVTFHRYGTTPDALDALRAKGYRIVATTPHQSSSTPETFDVEAGPFALVFGTEHAGISQTVIDSADEFLQIPMHGFVDSLNVSACAAILIYMLSQRVRLSDIDWGLGDDEKAPLLYNWMRRSVKDADRILKKYEEKL